MLFTKERNPRLNTQTESICAKLFVEKNIPSPIVFLVFNPLFNPEGFPINELNYLALDRVKSGSAIWHLWEFKG